jgi:hypothetical protein
MRLSVKVEKALILFHFFTMQNLIKPAVKVNFTLNQRISQSCKTAIWLTSRTVNPIL